MRHKGHLGVDSALLLSGKAVLRYRAATRFRRMASEENKNVTESGVPDPCTVESALRCECRFLSLEVELRQRVCRYAAFKAPIRHRD